MDNIKIWAIICSSAISISVVAVWGWLCSIKGELLEMPSIVPEIAMTMIAVITGAEYVQSTKKKPVQRRKPTPRKKNELS
jgi:hypothetical protein